MVSLSILFTPIIHTIPHKPHKPSKASQAHLLRDSNDIQKIDLSFLSPKELQRLISLIPYTKNSLFQEELIKFLAHH